MSKHSVTKTLVASASALALTLALAGCSSPTSPATDASSAAQKSADDTVVVYSTHPEKLLEAVAQEFTDETGINVEFINLKGELADRVESEIGNPQADVMYGGDVSTYLQLAEKGAYAPTQPAWASDLPSEFKAADGAWYATIKTPVMMFYNTDTLDAADAPKDWVDLTDPKYAGQVVARDYLSSSMRSAVCNLIYYFESQGGIQSAEEFLKGLDANVKNYYNSGSMMFQAIGTGEAQVGISTLNDITDNVTKNGMPLQQINAESGNVVIGDCVAALAGAKHADAAAQFVEFVGTKDLEVMLAEDFGRMPVLPAAIDESPAWMQEQLNVLPSDWSVIAENQGSWLSLWQDSIYTQDKTVAGK